MHNISDREIRKVLAKLYDNPGQARMIVEDIHLRWATIPLSLTMDEYWSNIWRETKLQHKELELIERVREDYLRNREIDEIYEQIIKKSKGNESSPNPSPNSPQRPSTFDKFVATFKKPILYITAGFLYITAGLLLLLDISLLFNILDPMIFLKKLLRYNPVILFLIAGLVVFIISGTIVYDLISMQRKKSYSRLSRSAHRTIVVTCLIVLCIPLFFWRYTTVETGVGLSPTNSHIGVCDGSCIFDTNRLTGKLKQQAANYFQQKQNTLACQYLQWAALGDITEPETTNKELDVARSYAEDATDAEAKIDYENRCTNIQCPCISFVVAVQFIDQGNQNADYINGMSRSILQGAYLQQKKWNRSHPNGFQMYLFIANTSAYTPQEQGPEPTQQEIADQIVRIQQRDQDHIIVGVVGLPIGTNTLTNKLNDAHIPMVSIAPLSSSDSQPYLFSVAPSLDDEINKVVNFCSRFQKIEYYYDQNDNYSQTFTQLFQASLSSLCPTNLIAYGDITSLANQVAASDSDLIIFIGPAEDTTSFLIQLRKEEAVNNHKSHTVVTGDNLYQWVYKYFMPDERTAFNNIRFVAFTYPDPTQLSNNPNILDDFSNTFDPGSKRSGNIYTYRRASSDAILTYDALSLLVNAQKNITCTISCDTSVWGEILQRYIRSKPFKGTSGQISFTSGESTPNSKFLFFLVIQDQKNGNPQDFSGRY